jgi:transcriptional regulator with XRE-family HTH domain
MINNLGKYLRKLRIDKGEVLKDMADNLKVSSAFLSSVENGKKKMPNSWFDSFKSVYHLTDSQMDELRQAVSESSESIEINIKEVDCDSKRLAISFARKFDSLDEETTKAIFELLNKED